MTALVATAGATTTEWMRMNGQVTAVVTGRSHTWEIAAITDHTNGLCPARRPGVEVIADPQGVEAASSVRLA